MAKVVRETPRISDSNDPSAAATAPARTTGTSSGMPATRTVSANGVVVELNSCGPSTVNAAMATTAYTAVAEASAMGIARGMVRAGSRTSSPRVAIRA